MSVCVVILVGCTERFIVLVGVEELEENFRNQLRRAEADIHDLQTMLADALRSRQRSHQCSNCADNLDPGEPNVHDLIQWS